MGSFLVVRHAQSTWNAAGRWQGQADPPLSPVGREQAAEAASRIDLVVDALGGPPDAVISSDLMRARATAEILADAVNPRPGLEVERLLRELDVGEWSGLTHAEIEKRWPGYLPLFESGGQDRAPGGESLSEFDHRVSAAGRAVSARAGRTQAQRLLIVAHGGVIRAMARLHGLALRRPGHLNGLVGRVTEEGLIPELELDLLSPDVSTGAATSSQV